MLQLFDFLAEAYLSYVTVLNHDLVKCFLTLQILINMLIQACKLKLGDLKGALLDADFALREIDDNVKALYRQGQVGNHIFLVYQL